MQNSIELLKSLNALWYVTTESEDEAGNVTVSKRNILPLVDAQKFQSMDAEELWDDISSFCVDYPIEDSFIGNNEAQAFINARSHLLKQLSVDALICADRTDLIEDDYSLFATEIAASIGVNLDEINPEFWSQTYKDGLTPLQAAVDATQ